ncbi:MAG: DNA helicase RecQ [Armatimonadota bacterium]|nr:DNA helicase RecQ [bacterium]
MAIQLDTSITVRARDILNRTFGYAEFRGEQQEIIEHVASGGDAFVLMPTGGGKSLCYQIPAMLRSGIGVVVSPLIALMQDQVTALKELGVNAEMLNSALSVSQQMDVKWKLRRGGIDLLYVAPERLVLDSMLEMLSEVDLALFAIDEAHCVSQWGHDFREEYLALSVLHERFSDVPRIALTATADEPTRKEIIQRLNLGDARTFIASFDRPNIRYQIVIKDRPQKQLLAFLNSEHDGDSGIVYCLSRKKTEQVAKLLQDAGKDAIPYHAGLNATVRKHNQERFLREDGVIIVATIAFGMGIDKPDVRFVAHLDLPKSIEAYYQETGRAGRDGLPSDAWMTYGMADVAVLRSLIESSEADDAHKRLEHRKLNALLGLCETASCRRKILLSYFGDELAEPCGNCDTCLHPVETWDGTLAAKKAIYVAKQTDERFGAGYLVDIMHGKKLERLIGLGHDKLSAFGKGTELSEREWSSVFRQLVSMGYLKVDMERYGSIKLTSESANVLKGDVTISFRKDYAIHEKKGKAPRVRAASKLVDSKSVGVFEALRAKRMELAKEQGVPPYVIFHDSTLKAMAETRPVNLDEMSEISGVGEHKLAKYGVIFLDVLEKNRHEQQRD